ncbi:MAG: tRNA epoxyqueuosine(34) reductase QueG [Ktedonobacterales bacterium]
MQDETAPSLTERIKQHAEALGFDVIRVTSAEPFPEAERALKQRIASGLMDGLDWFTAERAEVASNPRALLPGARSVIALGTFYLTQPEDAGAAPDGPRGRVSRYAWGDDYHEVIRRRLSQLADYVRMLAPPGDEHTIPFVDTGRMVDRAVAERSGLGWYGKNTMILTKRWGSWVFLSELVTSLELEPDLPLATNCGQCTRCLEACPTGAFVAPYVLDNRRCISYLTIELRGAIPVELRPLIGDHIFGCDICQEVCPVNRVAETRLRAAGRLGRRGERLEFQPRAQTGGVPALIPLLALTDEQFRERFRASPVKRAKRRGLLRNVCVALGNAGDPVAVPALSDTLRSHDEPLVRGHAAWALGRIGGSRAAATLDAALRDEADDSVRREIAYAQALLSADGAGGA